MFSLRSKDLIGRKEYKIILKVLIYLNILLVFKGCPGPNFRPTFSSLFKLGIKAPQLMIQLVCLFMASNNFFHLLKNSVFVVPSIFTAEVPPVELVVVVAGAAVVVAGAAVVVAGALVVVVVTGALVVVVVTGALVVVVAGARVVGGGGGGGGYIPVVVAEGLVD
jgi:hypothetical protein